MQPFGAARVSIYRTMIYTTLLLIGTIGLIAQAAFGLGHGHGGHHAGGHPAGAHGHGGHTPGQHAQAHQSQDGRAQTEQQSGHNLSPLWTALSPLTIFSVCLGIGATGLLLAPFHWATPLVALAALAGGAAFYGAVVRPLWGFVFRFASTPGRALEGTVATEAEALSRFDARGRGLVRLHIDGQIVRVLATLEPGEPQPEITPGERLTVTSVDSHSNTCRVARL